MHRRSYVFVTAAVALLVSAFAWALLDHQNRTILPDPAQTDLGPAVQVELRNDTPEPTPTKNRPARPTPTTPTSSPPGAQIVPPKNPAAAGDDDDDDDEDDRDDDDRDDDDDPDDRDD